MPNTPPNLMASADIRPCRFVTPSGEFTVAESNSGERPIGISQEGGRQVPLNDVTNDGLAAKSGENIRIFGEGDECLLMLGGSVTAGDYVKPDNDGAGVTAGAAAIAGARALQTGVSGEKIRVQVTHFSVPA